MGNVYYPHSREDSILADQKSFHEGMVQRHLCYISGVRESEVLYAALSPELEKKKQAILREMLYYMKQGIRITCADVELTPGELSGAAESIARGLFRRDKIYGKASLCTEYRLVPADHS